MGALDKATGMWYAWRMQSELEQLHEQIATQAQQIKTLTKALEAVSKAYADAAAELVAMKQARLIEQEPELVNIADLDATGSRFGMLEPD